MQKAIEKIKAEMEKEKNPYVQVVGEFMLQQVKKYPESAEKVLATDKTILKSLEEMRKVAEKKKVGNVGILTPDEGYAVVLKYFGIDGKSVEIEPSSVAPEVVASAPASAEFDVKLDDFL